MTEYKKGDSIVVRSDLIMENRYSSKLYKINGGEKDVRGKTVRILKVNYDEDGIDYDVEDYTRLGHDAIDHEKTAALSQNTEVGYEVF